MDKRKIVIVGASHGGHESAIELLDKYNDVESWRLYFIYVLWDAVVLRK